MANKYGLICMDFDGDYIKESDRFTRDGFESVEEAWEHANDMGSKWFFFPWHFVVTASGKTIVDTPENLKTFKGKRVETIAKVFKAMSKLPEMQGVDPDTFDAALSAVEIK